MASSAYVRAGGGGDHGGDGGGGDSGVLCVETLLTVGRGVAHCVETLLTVGLLGAGGVWVEACAICAAGVSSGSNVSLSSLLISLFC